MVCQNLLAINIVQCIQAGILIYCHTFRPPPDDLFGDEDKAEAETDDLFDAPMRKNVTESSQNDSLFSSDNLNSKPTGFWHIS